MSAEKFNPSLDAKKNKKRPDIQPLQTPDDRDEAERIVDALMGEEEIPDGLAITRDIDNQGNVIDRHVGKKEVLVAPKKPRKAA